MIPTFHVQYELTTGLVRFDINAVAGSSYDILVSVTENGVAKDITGTTWTFRYAPLSGGWQGEISGSIVSASGGTAKFEIRETVIATGNHRAQIKAVLSGNDIIHAQGRFSIIRQVNGDPAPPPAAAFFRFGAQHLELYNADTETWHQVYLVGAYNQIEVGEALDA